ncbi:MAG: M48 family metalloprotease [Pirellulales bacterium]|nr:M48 family metalloprotease [Pirellulales bacterium]
MPILVQCTECGRSFRVREELAGRTAKCGGCHSRLVIPKVSVAAPQQFEAPFDLASFTKELRAALAKSTPDRKISNGYRLAVMLATLTLLALPIGYLAIVGAAAFLLIRLGTSQLGAFSVLDIALFAAGCVVVLFLLRPIPWLFYRASPDVFPIFPIRRYPLIEAIAREISLAQGSPMPTHLKFDCELNASASFGHRLSDVIRQKQMVLTIGLPLLRNLSTTQIAGIIAHEMTHFDQRQSFRLTVLGRWLSNWVRFVAEQRNDVTLQSVLRAQWRIERFVRAVIAMGLGLAQALLVTLHSIAELMVAAVSRQMERYAYRRQAMLVGSVAFAETMLWLNKGAMAQRSVDRSLSQSLERRTLPDNLPELFRICVADLSADHITALKERLTTERAGLLDSHPSYRDTMYDLRKTNPPALLTDRAEAYRLIVDFEGLCRAVTRARYYELLGGDLSLVTIAPIQEIFPYWEAANSSAPAQFPGN